MAEPCTYSGNGHTVTIADPENITRDECLALAWCGSDAWNSWREEFPIRKIGVDIVLNVANFSRVDFCSNFPNFYGFNLGDWADFSGAIFGSNSGFVEHVFGHEVNFSDAKFIYSAAFSRAVFGHSANFSGAIFGEGGADFVGARFGAWANFWGSIFQGHADFRGVVFGEFAFFVGTMFANVADFSVAKFGVHSVFNGQSWDEFGYRFKRHEAAREAAFNHLRPNALNHCNFDGCEFGGDVSFSGREFLGSGSFAKTKNDLRILRLSVIDEEGRLVAKNGEVVESFYPAGLSVRFRGAPIFHACKLHQDFSFDTAEFPVATGSEVSARAYRTLKLAFSQQQATREEQRFFRLEMAEEAKAAEKTRDPSKWLYIAYRELADFGFSVRRPVLLLAAALLLMLPLYAWQAGLQACWSTAVDCSMTGPLIQFASAHALPGFEKLAEPASKALFGDQLGVWTVLTLLLHKAVSVLALFLIGLALRNLFKMK